MWVIWLGKGIFNLDPNGILTFQVRCTSVSHFVFPRRSGRHQYSCFRERDLEIWSTSATCPNVAKGRKLWNQSWSLEYSLCYVTLPLEITQNGFLKVMYMIYVFLLPFSLINETKEFPKSFLTPLFFLKSSPSFYFSFPLLFLFPSPFISRACITSPRSSSDSAVNFYGYREPEGLSHRSFFFLVSTSF